MLAIDGWLSCFVVVAVGLFCVSTHNGSKWQVIVTRLPLIEMTLFCQRTVFPSGVIGAEWLSIGDEHFGWYFGCLTLLTWDGGFLSFCPFVLCATLS